MVDLDPVIGHNSYTAEDTGFTVRSVKFTRSSSKLRVASFMKTSREDGSAAEENVYFTSGVQILMAEH